MNFKKVFFRLSDGRTSYTLIPEDKVDKTIERLSQITEAWVEKN